MYKAARLHTSKPGKTRIIALVSLGLFLLVLILASCKPTPTPVAGEAATWTPSPTGSPTCPSYNQLATPVGLNPSTRMIVILYDPQVKPNPGLDLSNGTRLTDVAQFVQQLMPDLFRPGDEISVFQLGYDTYPAARVTRQYSYLTIYPQLYVAPSYSTLTAIPPTGIPSPGYAEVATKNAFRVVSTERAATQTVLAANYNCEVAYYNQNVIATATTWQQMKNNDVNTIATAAAHDFGAITPARRVSSEMVFGGLYYGLYFATVDLKADCANYDECDLVIFDDLSVYNKNNNSFPISLNNVNVYTVMPNCRDINQPDCADLQSFWTTEFQKFGATTIKYWNGIRAEINLESVIGR